MSSSLDIKYLGEDSFLAFHTLIIYIHQIKKYGVLSTPYKIDEIALRLFEVVYSEEPIDLHEILVRDVSVSTDLVNHGIDDFQNRNAPEGS